MKKAGVVRPIDGLGRVVLPIELRKTLDLNDKDLLEISLSGGSIVLKKHNSTCIFCKSGEDLLKYKGQFVCKSCASTIRNL